MVRDRGRFRNSGLTGCLLKDDLEVIGSGKPKLGIVEKLSAADGSTKWITTDKVPYSEDGRAKGVLVYSTDITKLVETERSLSREVSRVHLLNQIARSTVGREDLYSIYQGVLRYLEAEMPVDIGAVHGFDESHQDFTVLARSYPTQQLAAEIGAPEGTKLSFEDTGFAACLRGQQVYCADLTKNPARIPEALSRHGLRSSVATPLLVEGELIGVLVVGRKRLDAFGPEERSFLAAISEHVALAVHQKRLHDDLQNAYEDPSVPT